MKTTASYDVYLKGFCIPLGVEQQDPPPAAPTPFNPQDPPPILPRFMQSLVPLTHLSPATLDALCDDFRAGVFKTAGKREPDRAMPAPAREVHPYLDDESINAHLNSLGLAPSRAARDAWRAAEEFFEVYRS